MTSFNRRTNKNNKNNNGTLQSYTTTLTRSGGGTTSGAKRNTMRAVLHVIHLCVSFFLIATRRTTTLAFSVSNIRPTKVLVTGAAGRTGRLVFEQLRRNDAFDPIALVRSERSGRKLIHESGCGLEQVVVCDVVTDLLSGGPTSSLSSSSSSSSPSVVLVPPEGLEGTDCMVICTSAVPVLSKASLVRAMLMAPIHMMQGKKAIDFKSLRFKFKRNQYPELVDYHGQVAQIELAKALGMQKVVVVSSMGGTDPNNFLNAVGKKPDGSGNGDILLWKRKAEKYLVESGLSYTIIHPGGLVDTDPGKEEIVLDVDDRLMETPKRSISRADVASLCVAALTVTKNQNLSVDCISRALEDDDENERRQQQQPRSAEDVLRTFIKVVGKTTNYSL